MMQNSQPLVSIITPVYNTEKYLAECIESVLNQNYFNWEYIIVNNKSTDKSLEIAEHYAKYEPRVRVVTNNIFLSLMKNWNHSMRLLSAESKYCKVVHADDWIFPECISKMVAIAEKYSSVGIVGAYRLDEDRVNLDGLPAKINCFNGREICRGQLRGRPYLFGSPTSLLIRSDIVRERDPFFDESTLQADKEACYEILMEHDFGFVHQVLTFTRRHNETITSKAQSVNTQRRFLTLTKYGPRLFSESEFKKLYRKGIEKYYLHLVKAFFELKDRDFFKHHMEEFERIGEPLNWAKIGKLAIWQLLNLRDTLHAIKRGIILRRKGNANPSVDLQVILNSTKSE